MATSKKKPESKALMRRKVSLSLTTQEVFTMKQIELTENKEKLLIAAKIGIIKQLYKDKLITANQYQYLLHKYGCTD